MSKEEGSGSNLLAKLSKIEPIYRYSFFIAVLVLFLLVWFFSVSIVRQGVDLIAFAENQTTNSLNLENTSTLDCSGSKADTPLCQERLLALSGMKLSKQLKDVLISKNVNQWGKETFDLSMSLLSEADVLYNDEFFGKSAQKYSEATEIFKALDKQAFILVEELLKKGFLLLEQENSELALEKFENVILIDPLNAKATKGITRSKVLEDLLASLREAQMLINTGNLDAAQGKITFAMNLDSENIKAQRLYRSLKSRLKERDIKQGLDLGYALLQKKNFKAALASFKKVISLNPALKAANEGIILAKEGIKQNKIISLKDKAIQSQEKEYWDQAYKIYEEILSLNPQVEFALEAKKYAKKVINLENELDRVLRGPDRLASPTVYDEASNLISYSDSFFNIGPRIKSKIQKLRTFLDKFSEKFILNLISDRKTEVSIERAGDLGKFLTLNIKLTPGPYVFIGKRKGYVTVRKAIEFYEELRIEVICTEKI